MKGRSPSSSRRLVVVSMDGLSVREWDSVTSLPNFSSLMARGVVSRSLRSVFPSLTYVAHTTMTTGRHPDAHGITHNNPLQPGVPTELQAWHWYAEEIGTPTLFDLAREAGMTSAAVLWPVSGRARITWNFPEIVALRGENQTLKVLRAGSAAYLLELQLRFGKYLREPRQPWLDDFVSRCAAHTIVGRKPRLLMTHLIALDDAKHRGGSDSPGARSALAFLDTALGRILAAIEDSGLRDETDIVVFGDHGHIDTDRRVRPNLLLKEAGLYGKDGGVFAWRAWARCSGGSAYIHVRPGDREAETLVLDTLEKAAGNPATGIDAILDRTALASIHGDPEACCALLGRTGIQFVEDEGGPLIEDSPAPGAFGADHGYAPDMPDYRGLFMAAGPGIARGLEIGPIEMVDIAPSLARLLGLNFAETDGSIIENMYEDL